MLNRILTELKTTQRAISLDEMSRRLGIERSALEGMIQYLVRAGLLIDDDMKEAAASGTCAAGSCGSSCAGLAGCPFIARMPKSYSLKMTDK